MLETRQQINKTLKHESLCLSSNLHEPCCQDVKLYEAELHFRTRTYNRTRLERILVDPGEVRGGKGKYVCPCAQFVEPL